LSLLPEHESRSRLPGGPSPSERLDDRLAWIFGSSRSGSTWLLRMLAELDGAVPADDPHLGHHLGVWRPIPLAWAASDDRPSLATVPELRRGKPGYFFADRFADAWRPWLRELIAARFLAEAEAAPSFRTVVVKEPGSQAAELLLSLFPRSRLVFLLRDGRDVVDSWLAGYRVGAWAQDEGAFPLAAHGREAFIRWQASVWAYRTTVVGRAYDLHDPARRVLVRYEDLLADPITELNRIAEVLEIAVEPDRLDEIVAAHEIGAVSLQRKGRDRRIRMASPGGWRRSMSRT
jgi:Sulfotransferase family